MSEYQYYEFRAIDRPLTDPEMDELRELSSRAEISTTTFTNSYTYGRFRGKPLEMMQRYFDAFVYVTNWGSRELMFRIPDGYLDLEQASAYGADQVLELRQGKGHVIVEFDYDDDPDGEWVDGERWMAALIGIRTELMRGDLRALYLGWLASIQFFNSDDDRGVGQDLEPPVPPGLGKLSGPLSELAAFLEVDDDLIAAAAACSIGEAPSGPERKELAKWIKGIPVRDKDAYLLKFMMEEGDVRLRAEMVKQFRDETVADQRPSVQQSNRRTIAELIAARDAARTDRELKRAEKKAVGKRHKK